MGGKKSKPAKLAAWQAKVLPPGVLFEAEVIEQYQRQSETEGDLHLGETLYVIDDTETEWWAISRDSQSYWVPASCLRKIEPQPQPQPQQQPPSSDSASDRKETAAESHGARSTERTVTVVHGYRGAEPQALTVSAGDRLVVVEEQDDWVRARTASGTEGWVPADFVQDLRQPEGLFCSFFFIP
jgi:hypothetical protein